MPTLDAIQASIADVLEDLDIENLQVVPMRWFNPTPPTIDVYPADPAQEEEGFGGSQSILFWIVRARVGTVDNEGQQILLLQMMEPAGSTSVRGALNGSGNLGDTVEGIQCERPTGYRLFRDLPTSPEFLGVEWRVRVHNSSEDVS